MKKRPAEIHKGTERPNPKKRGVERTRKRARETVEAPDVAEMRAHLLEELGVASIVEAMREEDNVQMLCVGVWPPQEIGSTLFAEMLMAAVQSSADHAQLILDSLDDLKSLAEGDEADVAAVERAASMAREKIKR